MPWITSVVFLLLWYVIISKQAVLANQDWIAPELNKDYAEWAEHNAVLQLLMLCPLSVYAGFL